MAKRQDYISWDEYFMGIALLGCPPQQGPQYAGGGVHRLAGEQSSLPARATTACPRGCCDDEYPWDRRAGAPDETKYPFVVPRGAERHSERQRPATVCGAARMYVALFPCNECAKAIIQSGVKEVCYYVSDKYADSRMPLWPASVCWPPPGSS